MMLIVKLRPKYYRLVRSGTMTEVYRETHPYWGSRIKHFGVTDEEIIITCKTMPNMAFKAARIRLGEGRPDWGAEPGVRYFVIYLAGWA